MTNNTLKKQRIIRRVSGLLLVLGLAAIFIDLAGNVWCREGFRWDAPIMLAIHQFSRPWLDALMRTLTEAGEIGAISLALLAATWFAWKNRYLDTASILISLGGSSALNGLLKILLKRPRPDVFPPLVDATGFSFPSGHVTVAASVFGFLAVLLWLSNARGWAVFSALWVPVVVLSRIYLGVHYPSDTLGALIFTSLWLVAVFAVRDRYANTCKQKTAEIPIQDQ